MSDYEKNKLSWWLLFLALVIEILTIPMFCLNDSVGTVFAFLALFLILASLLSRDIWMRIIR